MQERRTTWLWGGAGLVASGVLAVLWTGPAASPTAAWVHLLSDVLFASAILLLAIGLSLRSSIVARRPLGVIALAAVALWPLVTRMVPSGGASEPAASFLVLAFVFLIVPTAAALTGAVEIARARVVPSPWRWAPAWVLAAQAALWVLPQALAVSRGVGALQELVTVLNGLGLLSVLMGTVGLGIVAISLSAGQRADSVTIYP